MKIELDTDNLTTTDVVLLRALLDGHGAVKDLPTPAPKPTPKAKPAPVAETPAPAAPTPAAPTPAAPAVQAVPDPTPESDAVTMDDAVDRATALLSDGKIDQVRAALSAVGVARVTEMPVDKVPAFLEALEA